MKKVSPANCMEYPVSEDDYIDEDAVNARIVDKRDIEKYLRRYKKYKYPDSDCHHINLDFVGCFENLQHFCIEFTGEADSMGRNYHTRHFNFSVTDIKNLAAGNKLTFIK